MLTLQIPDEQLNSAFEETIKKIFAPDNYNNPLKSLIEKICGSSYSRGALTSQIEEKIVSKLTQFMETDEFDRMLGEQVAKAIAEREIKKQK